MEPIQTALTIDERDEIDGAKSRIRRLAAVVSATLEAVADSDHVCKPWVDDARHGLDDLMELIRTDIDTIDTAFSAADGRRILTATAAR